MRITSLGHGNAFSGMKDGNSSFLIEHNGKKMLFDCGTLTPYILRDEMGINFHDIDAIYISHAHADHVGGLPLILQSRYWIPKLDEEGKKILPKLFCSFLVCDEISDFLENEVRHFKNNSYSCLSNFIYKGMNHIVNWFEWEGINFSLKPCNHVDYGYAGIKPCYGLEFEVNNKKIAITADTADVWDLENYDIVFHDCEAGNYKSGVHAHLDDIIEKYNEIPLEKRPKILLTHFGNGFDHGTGNFKDICKKLSLIDPAYGIVPFFKKEDEII